MATINNKRINQKDQVINVLENAPITRLKLAYILEISPARAGWLLWELQKENTAQIIFKGKCRFSQNPVNYYYFTNKNLQDV